MHVRVRARMPTFVRGPMAACFNAKKRREDRRMEEKRILFEEYRREEKRREEKRREEKIGEDGTSMFDMGSSKS